MLQVVSELVLRNGAAVFRVFVNISKRFAYCPPLSGDLFDDKLLDIGLFWHFLLYIILESLVFLLAYDVLVILRVLDRIVSEEEALSLVDAVADPCTEVFVIELASPRLISFLHQSLQVLVVDAFGVAEVP